MGRWVVVVVSGAVAPRGLGDVEGFTHAATEYLSDDDGAEEEDDFQAFRVFHLNSGEVGLVYGDFLEVPEERYGDVGLFVFSFATVRVRRFARQGAHIFFGEFALFLPSEVEFRRNV